jgi:hypothetical protein
MADSGKTVIDKPAEYYGNLNKAQGGPGGGGSLSAALAQGNGPERGYIERQARFQALQLANGHGESFIATVDRAKAYLTFLTTEPAAE